MKNSCFSRRDLLKTCAAAHVRRSAGHLLDRPGRRQTPPASEHVTVGHIGVGGRGDLLRVSDCRGARAWPWPTPTRTAARPAPACAAARPTPISATCWPARTSTPWSIATPDHWHVPIAIAAARAKKDAYVEKPLGISIEQDLACRKVFQEHGRIFQYGTQQRSSAHCRLGCELVRSGRIGKVHTAGGHRPQRRRGRIDQGDPRAAEPGLRHVARPGARRRPSPPIAAIRREPTGSTTTRSATWPAGAPIRWTSWSGAATPTWPGPMTFEGTGEIPAKGLYNTVYNWDMKIQMADGVTMTFKPGGDSTKFIGTEGWIRISPRRLGRRAEVAHDVARSAPTTCT